MIASPTSKGGRVKLRSTLHQWAGAALVVCLASITSLASAQAVDIGGDGEPEEGCTSWVIGIDTCENSHKTEPLDMGGGGRNLSMVLRRIG